MLNYSAIPVIVVICYVAITAIKQTKIDRRWLPLVSCALGALLAAAIFYVLPEFIGTTSLTAAIISGAVSGLAATGTNQVFKQLLKAAENGEDLTKVNITQTATAIPEAPQTPTVNTPAGMNVNKTNETGGNPDVK